MKKITSLIDILSAQTEKAPERVIYRFLEYKNGEWDMQNITMRALYHKSLEIAPHRRRVPRPLLWCLQFLRQNSDRLARRKSCQS